MVAGDITTQPKQGRQAVPMSSLSIDIKSLQSRYLKVCYVPATSAGLRLLLLLRSLTVLKKQQGRWYALLSSLYYLDVYESIYSFMSMAETKDQRGQSYKTFMA